MCPTCERSLDVRLVAISGGLYLIGVMATVVEADIAVPESAALSLGSRRATEDVDALLGSAPR